MHPSPRITQNKRTLISNVVLGLVAWHREDKIAYHRYLYKTKLHVYHSFIKIKVKIITLIYLIITKRT